MVVGRGCRRYGTSGTGDLATGVAVGAGAGDGLPDAALIVGADGVVDESDLSGTAKRRGGVGCGAGT